jgi:hypothetical protein
MTERAPSTTTHGTTTNSVEQQPQDPQHRKITPFTPPRNNLSEDELLAKTFYDIVQIKADRGELTRIRKEPHDRRKMNAAMRSSYIYGGLAAIGTFIALRKLPNYWMNRSLSKRESFLHGRDGNPYYDLARKQGPWLPHIKIRRDGTTRFHEGYFVLPILITINATLACAMGAAVAIATVPKVKVFEAVADIPLSSGRSAVSDALCTDFLENYKRLPERLFTPKKLKGDDVTTNIKRFVENCQRRQQVERQLRIDGLLKDDDPVDIPKPGVPGDLALETDAKPDNIVVWGDGKKDFWEAWLEEDDDDDDDDMW